MNLVSAKTMVRRPSLGRRSSAITGKVLVVSGPSGVGKTTIVRKLLRYRPFVKSISATTRPPRPGEKNGQDYRFLSRSRFEEGLRRGDFLEHEEIFKNLYGTPRGPLLAAIQAGRIVVLDIDVRGARSLRRTGLEGFYVFIMPPSLRELKRRLLGRRSEDSAEADRRLRRAQAEMAQRNWYDLVVVNEDVDQTISEIRRELKTRKILR